MVIQFFLNFTINIPFNRKLQRVAKTTLLFDFQKVWKRKGQNLQTNELYSMADGNSSPCKSFNY